MRPYYYLLFIILALSSFLSHGQQQDVVFHLSNQFLQGKTIVKIKHDFNDPYLWVLAKNNEVYRVNTNTYTIDSYSSQFAAYNNVSFIDIAGRSKDTVFIVTNSDGMIKYEAGSTALVHFPGDILNSVGVDWSNRLAKNTLLIGGMNDLYLYNMDTKTVTSGHIPLGTDIFEATYRRVLYTGYMTGNADTVSYHPVIFTNPTTIYQGYLWLNSNTYGTHLKTAFYSPWAFSDEGYVYGDNLFWGTEKGLSQNNWDYSYSTQWPSAHYLDGIPVNKITDIFGLTAFSDLDWGQTQFGSPGLTQQNLLVGTDNGLYFSSSILEKYQSGNSLRDFTLFHYDELGTIRVNDIAVNVESTAWPVCEDGVWVACDNGLNLIKPDYAQITSVNKMHAAVFEDMPDTLSSIKICSGTSITTLISSNAYKGHSIQWYKDGREMPGQSQNVLLINTDGDYYAVLYDACQNLHVETNHLKVEVIASPVFSFNYPDKLQFCDSIQTTLKTTNNPRYHYRWYTDGVLNGETDYNYTATKSGKYKVEVSSCTNSWIPSKEIEVDLVNLPVPIVTADKSHYCAGENAALSVNVPIDASYTISWYRNGTSLSNDDNKITISVVTDGDYSVIVKSNIAACTKNSNSASVTFTPVPVYTFNYPDKLVYCSGTLVSLEAKGSNSYQYRWYKDGILTTNTNSLLSVTGSGKYRVEVSACPNSWVPSKEVDISLIDLPTPVIQSDKATYCYGDQANLSLTIPVSSQYSINWYRDGSIITAAKDRSSFTTDMAGNYKVVVTSNLMNIDGTTCVESSIEKGIVFNPIPTIAIQKIIRTTLCDGQRVDLKVSYENGSVKWSTGDKTEQISVNSSGTYKATVTSSSGCASETSVDVKFFPNPVLNIPDALVCVPSHKTVTLTAPPGMASYAWNGKPGTNTYLTEHPQTVSLIVTDQNGCQAKQDILVADECADIRIPNTFTPNGDGINDVWTIQGLEYDATATVKVFTRYGRQVFFSKGYKPWDGTFQGRQLPAGPYYYVITAKKSELVYSGSITIIY